MIYFIKKGCLFGVDCIFYLGGICVGFLSKVVLLNEVECWWIIEFKEWFGGFLRFEGIVIEVGDECVCEWLICSFVGWLVLGDNFLFIGGCLKNEGGSFCNCIGSEFVEVVLGCELVVIDVGLMIWNKVFKLLFEFCWMWIIVLLFFFFIVS